VCLGIGGLLAQLKRFVAISSGYGVLVNSLPDALREHVRRSVVERRPIDNAERSCIDEFLIRFDALERPFDEHADPVHVTGSAIVVGARGVVLLRHKRLGFWLQPGGHIDEGEAPWDAALRETVEETGLVGSFAGGTPQLVHVDVHPGGRGHTHLDLRYLIEGGDADPRPGEGESRQIAWFDWTAAIERAGDERLKSALRSLMPAQR
jgi:8-oxo-dGTP pyrophosphatase MutT (NUDIX family)